MKTIICDRCGKKIDEDYMKFILKEVDWETQKGIGNEIDICASCDADFTNWLEYDLSEKLENAMKEEEE